MTNRDQVQVHWETLEQIGRVEQVLLSSDAQVTAEDESCADTDDNEY